ncbi:MAG: response regulator [Planctomycetota bacterium]|nr:response regulator [Planctomycetota bacterium]
MGKRNRGSTRGDQTSRRNLSTFDIAEMIEVDPGSVANWIDSGALKAHRTPGGHRRVAVDDLVRFLREHKMPVPEQLKQTPVHVLIVDDEPDTTRIIARAIEHSHPDYELVEVHDGFRAGTLVATLKPDVVILDLRMPGMDGFEVCRMIKSNEATRHASVIAITAYPSEENNRRILDCGAKMCMPKPLDLAKLVEQVELAVK